MSFQEKIIVALDVESESAALKLVDLLAPHVGYFKLGLELLSQMGLPQAVKMVHDRGGKVFLDGKFNDIPNTVAKASAAVAGFGVAMFDVHASSGVEAMQAAVRHRQRSAVLAVTVLTSFDDETSHLVFGSKAAAKVKQFTRDAMKAGVQGIVCSAHELTTINEIPGSDTLLKVIPGIRPSWADPGDQKRVFTPKEAVEAGATHLVIGRPITQPPREMGDPASAVRYILDEISGALQ